MEVLLIGGHHDGERFQIKEGTPYLYLHILPTLEPSHAFYFTKKELTEMAIRTECYKPFTMHAGKMRFTVFSEEHLKPEDVLMRLIANYKGGGDTEP